MLYNLPHTCLLDVLLVLTSRSDQTKITSITCEINKGRLLALSQTPQCLSGIYFHRMKPVILVTIKLVFCLPTQKLRLFQDLKRISSALLFVKLYLFLRMRVTTTILPYFQFLQDHQLHQRCGVTRISEGLPPPSCAFQCRETEP